MSAIVEAFALFLKLKKCITYEVTYEIIHQYLELQMKKKYFNCIFGLFLEMYVYK